MEPMLKVLRVCAQLTNPKCAARAQVFAGTVQPLQTGVNTLGGTPVKPQAERARTGDQLRDDVDAMNPDASPEV